MHTNDELAAEIREAVDDYQRVWPVPYALAPNLELAVRALAALEEVTGERDEAEETLRELRIWAFDLPGDDGLEVLARIDPPQQQQ